MEGRLGDNWGTLGDLGDLCGGAVWGVVGDGGGGCGDVCGDEGSGEREEEPDSMEDRETEK